MIFKFEGKHVSFSSDVEATISVLFECDNIETIFNRFRDFLAGCGYQPESIKEWIGE